MLLYEDRYQQSSPALTLVGSVPSFFTVHITPHREREKDMTRVEKFCVEGIEKASEIAMEGARM